MEKHILLRFLVISYVTICAYAEECKDKNTDCGAYATGGYCETRSQYISYMILNCQKSCNLCKVVDGGFSDWSPWASCSMSCGGGTQERQRTCDNPAPENGGADCSGDKKKSQSCNTNSCCPDKYELASCKAWKSQDFCEKASKWYPFMSDNCKDTCGFCQVQPGYSSWSSWTSCSTSCGSGTQNRQRSCNSPDGASCIGEEKTTQNCNTDPCTTSCKDVQSASQCKDWTSLGYCAESSENNYYMKGNCMKTCGWCKEKTVQPSATCGKRKEIQQIGRIVGGVNAAPNNWVWQGGMYYLDDFMCGGALIAEDVFLTAAHCVSGRGVEGLTIVMGDHQRSRQEGFEQVSEIEKITVHEGWSWTTIENDIAILKLKKKYKLNDKVGLVCLPKENEEALTDTSCYITGWGRTGAYTEPADILQEAQMPIIPNDVCNTKNLKIVNKMLCAGFVDESRTESGCRGDSGGPYVCKRGDYWELQGLVSWGSNKCEASHKWTVFTRVNKYITWIDEMTKTLKK